MNENLGFGFLPPEDSKSFDSWLFLLLALIFWGPNPSSPSIKLEIPIENIHIAEAKISTEK